MAKLTTETISKLLVKDKHIRGKYLRRIGVSIDIEPRSVRTHLEENKENGILTKINSLYCIKNLLEYPTLEYAIDKSNDLY